MSTPVTVRLDNETHRKLARLVRQRRRSKSELIREGIDALAARDATESRPYDGWKDVIGILKGGPSDLSERTGEKVRRLLEARSRGRR